MMARSTVLLTALQSIWASKTVRLSTEEIHVASFVDRVVLHVSGGTGGHGCVSVHREKNAAFTSR